MERRISVRDEIIVSVIKPIKDHKIRMVSCGDFHTLALDFEGRVWTWLGGGEMHNRG